MFQLHKITQKNTDYFFITYNNKLVQVEPSYKLTEFTLEDVPSLMIFHTIGNYFTSNKEDTYSYFNYLTKSIPSSITNISIEDLGLS